MDIIKELIENKDLLLSATKPELHSLDAVKENKSGFWGATIKKTYIYKKDLQFSSNVHFSQILYHFFDKNGDKKLGKLRMDNGYIFNLIASELVNDFDIEAHKDVEFMIQDVLESDCNDKANQLTICIELDPSKVYNHDNIEFENVICESKRNLEATDVRRFVRYAENYRKLHSDSLIDLSNPDIWLNIKHKKLLNFVSELIPQLKNRRKKLICNTYIIEINGNHTTYELGEDDKDIESVVRRIEEKLIKKYVVVNTEDYLCQVYNEMKNEKESSLLGNTKKQILEKICNADVKMYNKEDNNIAVFSKLKELRNVLHELKDKRRNWLDEINTYNVKCSKEEGNTTFSWKISESVYLFCNRILSSYASEGRHSDVRVYTECQNYCSALKKYNEFEPEYYYSHRDDWDDSDEKERLSGEVEEAKNTVQYLMKCFEYNIYSSKSGEFIDKVSFENLHERLEEIKCNELKYLNLNYLKL